jgi:hypothetical protein
VEAALGAASRFPSYRAQLDREGKDVVHETVVGDESLVRDAVPRYSDAGATEFVGSSYGDDADRARTVELLAAVRQGR